MENMKIIYYVVPILVFISFSILYSSLKNSSGVDIPDLPHSIYEYNVISIDGDSVSVSHFKDKKILIVNVASKCGYTYQYEDLQKLYEEYSEDLVILGFPSNDFLWQEPGKNEQIKKFCSSKYGVTFPMFSKISVKKSDKQHPLYSWLSNKSLNGWNNEAPSWNFCKYLIDENGNLIKMFSSKIKPFDDDIVQYLNK